MFIKVTRSAAVSALAAGREVRLDTTGEIFQMEPNFRSKRACRRLLSNMADFGWYWYNFKDKKVPNISYSVRV